MTLLSYNPPQHPFLDIVYRDDDVVVINKPNGLLSVPGKDPAHRDSSWARLAWVFPDIRVVHRLDMATSGLLVFALHKTAQAHLQRQFEQRRVYKRYLAEVWGALPAMAGAIDLAMRCDWPNRPRQMVDLSLGKPALTFYRVLAQRQQQQQLISRVELEPFTGRSHQLRVHMQALGTPILGDKFYAHEQAYAAAERLFLHAQQLGFFQPSSQQWLSFTAPADF